MNNHHNEKLSQIKAIALDLDGTLLLPDKSLGERSIAALKTCAARGIQVIFSTGRSLEGTEPYRQAAGVKGPQVYYNGAEVVDMPGGGIIHTQLVARAPVLFCLELARQRGLYFQAYFPSRTVFPDMDREMLMAEKSCPEAGFYSKNSGVMPVIGDLEAAIRSPSFTGLIKCMFITKEEYQEGLRNAITERFGDSVSVTRSSPIYLEILAQGVSKGEGLLHALAYAGIDPENSIAFGDEENDLPMFRAAGFSAAPANSVKAVLEAASFHIPSNAEEGAARFLEERILA